jgi:hypothetical protein
MIALLKNSFLVSKHTVILSVLIVLMPFVGMTLKVLSIAFMLLNGLRVCYYTDQLNNSYYVYFTIPLKRVTLINEKYVYMFIFLALNMTALLIASIYTNMDITYENIFLLTEKLMLIFCIGGFYIAANLVIGPAKCEFVMITVSICIGLIYTRFGLYESVLFKNYLSSDNYLLIFALIFISAIVYYANCIIISRKQL